MLNPESEAAYNLGYKTFQKRRGANPFINISREYREFEEGWAQAYADNAKDESKAELESRVERIGFPEYRKALDTRATLDKVSHG